MAKWTLENLLGIDPQEFEILLSRLFSNMGYRTELTQYSRDRGVDIVIKIENFGLTHTWLVQAKRYSGSVGVKEVREYSSLRYRDRVDGVIIAATSSFTKEAMEEAAEHNLKLIDGNLLVEMLNYYLPDGCTEVVSAGKQTDKASEEIGGGAILKRGEMVLANQIVTIGNEKFTITLTNRNIFLKKESSGFFSKSSDIEERIEIKEILGIHTEPNRVILITGNKNLKMYPISSRRLSELVEIFQNLRPEYLKGEHLDLSSRNGTQLTILTNKRIIVSDISGEIQKEIIHKKIVGVELKGGFLKRDQLVVSDNSNAVTKHYLDVDNPILWKDMIEQCVRTL
ncbi:restriction endonuclease [Methanolobus mangrovi]|uniref:Restriction endonuclease n=1 Tax=Methanolobus mangrovi TaxID=3072977 RepID=A0AA51UE13_9EURY|nr:restriction endonuclease [Methanolobus mangrovi]WMW21358.1 restriction endonuclease [Methanolobus mangrovi]